MINVSEMRLRLKSDYRIVCSLSTIGLKKKEQSIWGKKSPLVRLTHKYMMKLRKKAYHFEALQNETVTPKDRINTNAYVFFSLPASEKKRLKMVARWRRRKSRPKEPI